MGVLYLQREVETRVTLDLLRQDILAVLPAASECKEQEASQRTVMCAGRRADLPCRRAEAGKGPGRYPGLEGTAWTSGHGAPPDKCTAVEAWDCDACPIYSSLSQKTRSWSRPVWMQAAWYQAGKGAPLLGRALAPGWCAFILLLPSPCTSGPEGRCLASWFSRETRL